MLAGLALNAAFGHWRADPAVALGIAALAIHEGRKAWNGEGCCPPTAIHGEIATRLEQDFCH